MSTITRHIGASFERDAAGKRRSWLRELIAAMPIVILVSAVRSGRR